MPKNEDNRGSHKMPLTQEKPRFEMSFTNNNDHNYLHKKFKKVASTVPRNEEQSSESDSSQQKEIPHIVHTNITNHSISAAHPEIEKIKTKTRENFGSPVDSLKLNVQTKNENNYSSSIGNKSAGETSAEENQNKTEDIIESDSQSTGARYVCPYCSLPCAKPSVLRKHIRAHTNERPYPCEMCGIAFKTKSNLYKHCRSRSHVMRSQGGENAPPINEDDWSQESESDTSLPPPSGSESGLESFPKKQFNSFSSASESSTAELINDRSSPIAMMNPPNKETNQFKSIYKPKFHSILAICPENDLNIKKVLSPNPNFLKEHISKIISDNEAIVEVFETPLQKKFRKIKHLPESKTQESEESFTNMVKFELTPLNLSKSSDDATRRKRSHSDSFLQPEHYKSPLNPEGSIIKDLLLKTKNCTTGLQPITCLSYDSSVDNESYKHQYSKPNNTIEILDSTSSRETTPTFSRDNLFLRSNSINVTLHDTLMLPDSGKIICTTPNKPGNLVIKPESNDIIAPLPSPGPLLGSTRLVDSRIEHYKMKPISGAKRRIDSRNEICSARYDDIYLQRLDTYPQMKKRCTENNKNSLRTLEELSHSPIRQNSMSLQMFGGEVKIISNSGNTTTLRIEPTRQLSPIMMPQSANLNCTEGEASNIVRSGLHSGGTIMHNPPTPKDTIISPVPKTPRIMLSIAASVPTPNLNITSIPTPNITHFQFPPLSAITAFNPLTLPPLSPSISPNGATTILHGGKLIPHVPGIPGPNTQSPYSLSGPTHKFPQNGEYLRNNVLLKDDVSRSPQKSGKMHHQFENQVSDSTKPITKETNTVIDKHSPALITRFGIRQGVEKSVIKISQSINKCDDQIKDSDKNMQELRKVHIHKSPKLESINSSKIPVIGTKVNDAHENVNFNFENLITKAEIYNSTQQVKQVSSKKETVIEHLNISTAVSERSETSYFQKSNSKNIKEETKTRFLRPSSLPLKPGTFTPKKHHGITPNANTMPLISPETPRPAKAYGQLYLNGNAYTYLGLKCSTKVFYCTLNRPQPTYVPNQVSLSMYCNWQILLEETPNLLGLSTLSLMALYDSRHRPQDVTIARMKCEQILTHSSQWKKDFPEKITVEIKKADDSKSTSETQPAKSKELAGGFESNEEYTYVRGRGRGRYVCLECGIRCKKPSMLKKHIRTHTDVRPYTCKHCCFSFKTKGNLTKHMKSKAHYKKCSELGINPNEDGETDNSELNQGSGETDEESDSDGDDGNEGETESSDTDSYKSRLPEHEAAHCLLSLSASRPSSTPGLLTSARPTTYPYTPAGKEDNYSNFTRSDSTSTHTDDSQIEADEPMDLSKGDFKASTISDISTARESSVLASLASNTAKLPVQAQWTNGEPMLHAYLTERALQDTKIKQSQFMSSLSKNARRQELTKIVEHESSNLVLNGFHLHNNIPSIQSSHIERFNPAMTYSRATTVETKVSHSLSSPYVSSSEMRYRPDSPRTSTAVETNKTVICNDVNTSTENAKFVASEYLKMARETDNCNVVEKVDKQENTSITYNSNDNENRDSKNTDHRNIHSETIPIAQKVVIGAGGIAFKIDSKNKDFQQTAAYTPGRLTEDGRSVCVVCNKSFSKPSQLRLHINIHYMERPYRCSACAVSFRTRGHLQKHERSGSHHNKVSMTSTFGAATSSNPRPFRCTDCSVAFRIHGHLAKHLRSKMHVMRLECLSKLPFGTFAEIERTGISLTDIDTTDCANSLASLQLLAQRLHAKDPSKLGSWDPTMVPPLLPAGRESSDDEDGALHVDLQHGDKDNSEIRTNAHNAGPDATDSVYSATDT